MSTHTVTVTYRTGRGEQDIEMIEHVTSLRIHFGALILRDTAGVERCWPPREWTGYVSEPDEEPAAQPAVTPLDLARASVASVERHQRQQVAR